MDVFRKFQSLLTVGRRKETLRRLGPSAKAYLAEHLRSRAQYSLPPDGAAKSGRLLTPAEREAVVRDVRSELRKSAASETYADRMLAIMREKGMRETEVYKAAGVDRKLFSRIASHPEYRFSKNTAVSLALGLRLTLEEARSLLACAGYSFSDSDQRDVILAYFFDNRLYNIHDVNDILVSFGERTLSGR